MSEPATQPPRAGRGRHERGRLAPALLAVIGVAVAVRSLQRRGDSAPQGVRSSAALARVGPSPARSAPSHGDEPPTPPPGRPRLVTVAGGTVRHGELAELPVERFLTRGTWVLGRARDVDVRLPEHTVSPRHALLDVHADGRVFVSDLGALNGLAVDGIPISQSELHDGNRLQLGEATLVYRTDPEADDGGRHDGQRGQEASGSGL